MTEDERFAAYVEEQATMERRDAMQIAARLPRAEKSALRILDMVREMILWRPQAGELNETSEHPQSAPSAREA